MKRSTGLGAAGGYVGGRILDLRGLGSVRTLTLVDGKRFVPSTTQATVDTNMVPSILLSRAEVVSYAERDDILRCYDLHANAYVTKPIHLDGFLAAVGSIVSFWLETATRPPSR